MAATALRGPVGNRADLDDDFDAAEAADGAEYPLLGKRDPQEAAWLKQLAPLPGGNLIPPSFGYPSDDFLWHHIHFDHVDSFLPMSNPEATTRVRDMLTAKAGTDPFLQAFADFFDRYYQLWGLPPGYGVPGMISGLAGEEGGDADYVSADDARRFLQYGGFPRTAPARGTPEFRVEVEAVKARWASCDVTNPADPYRVLTEVVATAQAEWDVERGGQSAARNTIVDSHVAAWTQMRLANEAMIESIGQAWVAERALAWQRNILKTRALTTAEKTNLNSVITGAQNKISVQVGKANQAVTAARGERTKAETAQTQANATATTGGFPAGRGLTYAHQSVQIVKALTGAAEAAAAASNTAWQASKTTGTTSDTLWAQAQAQMYAVQAQFRRQAAEYAEYEAHTAALSAAAEVQHAADLAARARNDRLAAEAAEAKAKVAAADAHARMLAAEADRADAATQRAKAESERNKAAAAATKAESQNATAQTARNTADAQASVAATKRQDAEMAERHASDMRNASLNAALNAKTMEARAAAAEAKADAMDAGADADAARAAAQQARAAANTATQAATNARAAADEATAAAAAARSAATKARAAADRAKANADAAQADVAVTNGQLMAAHAAAADAIGAAQGAAQAVENAKRDAATAAAKAQQARDEADAAQAQADLSTAASADALGRATAAANQAAATRDAAQQTSAVANDAIAMGAPFMQADVSAGMAVLVGQEAKTLAEQQAAAADAMSAEAARAAQAAHTAATNAQADAKAAAEAAARAADDAAAAQQSVKQAAGYAATAAREAALAVQSEARTAQYHANAQKDAATAARYASEAAADADAAWNAADEAERDAAAARQAADNAEAAAAAARDAADRAEADAAAAEAAAARALEDAQQAQANAALAQQNADERARAALGVNSPTGEAGVQALPHVTDEVVRQTPIQCPPLTGSRYCETTVTHHITGTIDFVLVTCPDLNDTYCPGASVQDHLTTVPVDTTHEQLVQLTRDDVVDILKHVAGSLVSDYIDCAKGIGILDGKAGDNPPEGWGVSCAWVAADFVVPPAVAATARAIKAVRLAARTGTGVAEAYATLKALDISAASLARIEDDVYRALQELCVRHSFASDTPVLLADGRTKPISQVALGDRVTATDPNTGRTRAEPVTRTFTHVDDDLTDVRVRDEAGRTSVLHTTAHHPFYVDGAAAGWTEAGDLRAGSRLHTRTGVLVTVVAAEPRAGARKMYDLTVGDVHTYYVATAGTAVLVHNVNCFGRQVPYNRTELGMAAHRYRVGNSLPDGRNVAAAKVTVNGKQTVLIGNSKGDGFHSEDDIIQQINELRAGTNPATGEKNSVGPITELYSDRTPCFTCQDHMKGYLADDVDVTWAVLYDDQNPELAALMTLYAKETLTALIRANG